MFFHRSLVVTITFFGVTYYVLLTIVSHVNRIGTFPALITYAQNVVMTSYKTSGIVGPILDGRLKEKLLKP